MRLWVEATGPAAALPQRARGANAKPVEQSGQQPGSS